MQSNRNSFIEFIDKERALCRNEYIQEIEFQLLKALTDHTFSDYLNNLYKIFAKKNLTNLCYQINDIILKNNSILDSASINKIADICVNSGIFDSSSIFGNITNVIGNEPELNQFLTNPLAFINAKKCSPADIFALELMGKRENLKSYCLAKGIKPLSFSSNLSQSLQTINFGQFTSLDATNFESCINPKVKTEVLEKAKRPDYSGITEYGMAGVQLKGSYYSRKNIEETAKKVLRKKKATCQAFAQLGADKILKEIESGNIPPENIKIVSHKQGVNSHTFLLIGHHSEDLTDLSKCVIVDPWAAAMGYSQTNGVFILANYPYPGMLDKLICVYESINDKEHQARLSNQGAPVSQKPSTSVTSISMFNHSIINPKTETLKFFDELLNIMLANNQVNTNEYAVLYYLKDNFTKDKLSREATLTTAIDLFFNMNVSKNVADKSFIWGKESMADMLLNHSKNSETILKIFNKYSSVKNFCINVLAHEKVFDHGIPTELNKNHIIGLSHIICQKDYDRTFKPEIGIKQTNGR